MSLEAEAYVNVMETVVLEEIKLQLTKNQLHHKMFEHINISEVAAFSLNRLPSHYASSIEGIERQKNIIKHDRQLSYQIRQVVHHALLTIEKDPLRKSTPIVNENQDTFTAAKEVLPEIDNSLPKEELQWIVSFMETFLTNVKNKQVNQHEILQLYYLLYYYWQDNS